MARTEPAQRARRPRGPIAMAPVRRWSVYAVAAGVWTSGVGWLVFHYFLRSQGPFGPQANPLEPWWLKAHGLFAFAALWVLGLLWAVHVVNGWTSGRRRWSGAFLFAVAVVLGATGYLLYYVGDEDARNLVALAHWIIGLLAAMTFAWHRWIKTP